MTMFFAPHARERALERYGLKLSVQDLSEILRATKDGHACIIERCREGGDVWLYTFKGRRLYYVVRDQAFLITFLPGDAYTKARQIERRKSAGLWKQSASTSKRVDGREYNRAVVKREARKEAAE